VCIYIFGFGTNSKEMPGKEEEEEKRKKCLPFLNGPEQKELWGLKKYSSGHSNPLAEEENN
jgi:hypothetical protein